MKLCTRMLVQLIGLDENARSVMGRADERRKKMAGIGGDYTGFHFNDQYSADLGITRVSDGNRYNFDLLPSRNSKTAQNVGGHGTYYWDSYYTQKNFTINFAFDNLTEAQKRQLATVFGTNEISPLWFDEEPYKQYYVLANNTLQLKTIAFDDDNGSRIYKGEGSVQLVAYYPFALSRFKYIDSSPYSSYATNELQWYEASGMLESKGAYDNASSTNIKLFNPGDMESDCYIYYSKTAIPTNVEIKCNNVLKGWMTFSSAMSSAIASADSYIRINSRSNVIEGVASNMNLTGNIYNEYITGGDFFKIPVWANTSVNMNLESSPASCVKIDYMYTYY